MKNRSLFIVTLFVLFALSCSSPRQSELKDMVLVASGQQLDSTSNYIFYGFSFKGDDVNLLRERGRIPVLKNTSLYGREKCLLVYDIFCNAPLKISDSYTVTKSYRDEDNQYCYELCYTDQKLKPLQEYPFPVIGAAPGKEKLFLGMTLEYGFSLNDPLMIKRIYVVGYHDKGEKGAEIAPYGNQPTLISMARALVEKPSELAVIYRDTVVSPIRNVRFMGEKEVKDWRVIDFQ